MALAGTIPAASKTLLEATRALVPIIIPITLTDDAGGGDFSVELGATSTETPGGIDLLVTATTHGTISVDGKTIENIFIPTDTKTVTVYFEVLLYKYMDGTHTVFTVSLTPYAAAVPGPAVTFTIPIISPTDPTGTYNKYDSFKGALRVYVQERLVGFIQDTGVEVSEIKEVEAQTAADQTGAVAHFRKKSGYRAKLAMEQYVHDNLKMVQGISSHVTQSDAIALPGGGTGSGEVIDLIPEEGFLDEFSLRLIGYGKRADGKDVMWWFPYGSIIESAPITYSENAMTYIGMTYETVQSQDTRSHGQHMIGDFLN